MSSLSNFCSFSSPTASPSNSSGHPSGTKYATSLASFPRTSSSRSATLLAIRAPEPRGRRVACSPVTSTSYSTATRSSGLRSATFASAPSSSTLASSANGRLSIRPKRSRRRYDGSSGVCTISATKPTCRSVRRAASRMIVRATASRSAGRCVTSTRSSGSSLSNSAGLPFSSTCTVPARLISTTSGRGSACSATRTCRRAASTVCSTPSLSTGRLTATVARGSPFTSRKVMATRSSGATSPSEMKSCPPSRSRMMGSLPSGTVTTVPSGVSRSSACSSRWIDLTIPLRSASVPVGPDDLPGDQKSIASDSRALVAKAPMAISLRRRSEPASGAGRWTVAEESSPDLTSLTSMLRSERASSAERYRWFCGLAHSFWMVLARSSGTPCSTRPISGRRRSGAACHIIQAIWRSRPWPESPGNRASKFSPASSSYAVKPSEYRSLAGPTSPNSGATTSGAMYFAVPWTRLPVSLATRRARPKSPSLTRRRRSIIRLLGLTSPCTMPCECRNLSARRAWARAVRRASRSIWRRPATRERSDCISSMISQPRSRTRS